MNTSWFVVAPVLMFTGMAIVRRAKPSEKIRIGFGTLLVCAGTVSILIGVFSLL